MVGSLGKKEISKLFLKYQCQSSVLEIKACNMFLYKKLLFAESLTNPCVEPKEKVYNAVSPPKITWTADSDPKDIFSKCLIRSVSSLDAESEINFQAKVAYCTCDCETGSIWRWSIVYGFNWEDQTHIRNSLCSTGLF